MILKELIRGFWQHQTDMADVFRAAAGHHVDGQMILVVIVNDQAFQRIAHSFPALVVLIEYMPSIHIAVFVDHKEHLLEMQAEICVLHIGRQELPHRIRQPCCGHVPAVRQKRADLHMHPARACDFDMPGRELELQPVAPSATAVSVLAFCKARLMTDWIFFISFAKRSSFITTFPFSCFF